MPSRKKYAIVGLGGRVPMYTDALADPRQYKDYGDLVALCDNSRGRR